jgi:hypothetical protein
VAAAVLAVVLAIVVSFFIGCPVYCCYINSPCVINSRSNLAAVKRWTTSRSKAPSIIAAVWYVEAGTQLTYMLLLSRPNEYLNPIHITFRIQGKTIGP